MESSIEAEGLLPKEKVARQVSLKLMAGALGVCGGLSGRLRNQGSPVPDHIISKADNIGLETTMGKGMGRKPLCMFAVCDKNEFIVILLAL